MPPGKIRQSFLEIPVDLDGGDPSPEQTAVSPRCNQCKHDVGEDDRHLVGRCRVPDECYDGKVQDVQNQSNQHSHDQGASDAKTGDQPADYQAVQNGDG